MSDRFYMEQKKYKPKAYTKADIVNEISDILQVNLTGLEAAKKDCLLALRDKLLRMK